MSKRLSISDDLSLPLDAATQTFAFIARKGAGKTYAAGKLAECLMDAGVQVVILDSVGNWWGLRLQVDGKTPAYDIPVIGGLRGDIPLEATGGRLIADTIVETGRSLIIDVSQFSKGDRQKFATDLGERLWLKKKAEHHPSPVHLIIEESQLIVPESVRSDSARMVGIYEEIIRLGRNYGIGVSMISQRPQSVNKEVLNQTECLVVLQVNGKHERIALRDWITYHGAEKSLLDELPALPIGTAFVWSPQWLQILQKIKIGKKKTFDASATPKVGSHQVRRDLKPLQLDDLQERMAATIEKAKSEDPKELKNKIAENNKRISQLERQLARAPATAANGAESKADQQALRQARAQISALRKELQEAMKFIVNINTQEFFAGAGQPVDEAAITAALEGAVSRITKLIETKLDSRNREVDAARKEGQRIIRRLEKLLGEEEIEVDVTVTHREPFTVSTAPRVERRSVQSNGHREPQLVGDLQISKTQQRILDALAWYESIGVPEPSNIQVGAVALIDATGGHFSNTVGPLSSAGLVERGGGTMRLTEAGREVAAIPENIGTLDEYHEVLRRRVKKARAASNRTVDIMDAIISAGGEPVTNEEIGTAVGIDHTGGHFSNTIGPLSTLGLIERNQGVVRPTEILFPPGLS